MEHPAKLTIGELCDAVKHICPDEPTLHPAVQVATDAATRKALWWVLDEATKAWNPGATAFLHYLEKNVTEAGIEPWTRPKRS